MKAKAVWKDEWKSRINKWRNNRQWKKFDRLISKRPAEEQINLRREVHILNMGLYIRSDLSEVTIPSVDQFLAPPITLDFTNVPVKYIDLFVYCSIFEFGRLYGKGENGTKKSFEYRGCDEFRIGDKNTI